MLSGLKIALSRQWTRYVVDEDPDEKEARLRREFIADIELNTSLLAAFRAWEAGWKASQKEKHRKLVNA